MRAARASSISRSVAAAATCFAVAVTILPVSTRAFLFDDSPEDYLPAVGTSKTMEFLTGVLRRRLADMGQQTK